MRHKGKFIFLALLSFIACTNDKLPEPQELERCEVIEATYDDLIQSIVATNCAVSECHIPGTPALGDFRTYDGMAPFLNDSGIEFYVVDLKDDPENGMPPNWDTNTTGPKDLKPEDLEAFKCWIAAGYPEN